MITQLRIQNFKVWRDTGEMRFAPLTVFFGPNSSGKSSILEYLDSKEPVLATLLGREKCQSESQRLFRLGSLREAVQGPYCWAGEFPEDVGQRGEQSTAALLASRVRGTNTEHQVAEWLQVLGLVHAFEVRELAPASNLYSVYVRLNPDSNFVPLTDVGFGVSQVLPVLTLCAYVPEGSIVLLEQPEIHLHPRSQTGLADVLIDAIHKRKLQIILESHSEHLLTRLQRRMAEQDQSEFGIHPEEVALYFCSKPGAEAILTRLELDAYGNIINWPKDFFGDLMQERTAMMRAVIERRKGEAA